MVSTFDREGSAVFEALLRLPDDKIKEASASCSKELVATTCWYIWWQRRQIAHNEPVATPAKTSMVILAINANYLSSCKKNPEIRRDGWEKPKEWYTKLNVDAAFSVSSETGATGAVIRDDTGGFVAASNCALSSVADASTAEALALRDGLQLVGQVGCSRLMVQSDCMDVILTMQDGGNSVGAAAAIYEECAFLSRGFTHVLPPFQNIRCFRFVK
jgi:hypothetical protein